MWGWGGKRQRKEERAQVECSTSAAAAAAIAAQGSGAALASPEPGTPDGGQAAATPPEDGGGASAADIEAASVRAKALYFDSLIQGRTQRLQQQQQVRALREAIGGPVSPPFPHRA